MQGVVPIAGILVRGERVRETGSTVRASDGSVGRAGWASEGAPVGPTRRESWERPTVIVAGEFRSAVG